MACWATCAEMIVKWNRTNSFFSRPHFEQWLPKSGSDIWLASVHANVKDDKTKVLSEKEADDISFKTRVDYIDQIRNCLTTWGFQMENETLHQYWSSEEISNLLRKKGPLLCYGKFFQGQNSSIQIGGTSHAITVYGYAEYFGGVYYIDPWDGFEKKMSLAAFNSKIEPINKDSICTRITNHRN